MNRRQFTAAVLVAAPAAALVGCSSGAGGASGPAEIVFADWQWLEPGRGDRLWDAMNEFTKVNDQVTLKQESSTRADYEKKMQTEIGAGGGPDLLIVPQGLLYQMQSANLLLPLEGVEDDSLADQETFDGQRLVYGWELVNFGFIWNKSLLADAGVEPPTDMAGILAAAKQITAKTGKPGFAVRNSTNEMQPWWSDFQHWVYGYGGAWSADGKLTIANPQNVEAVMMLKKLYDSGSMPIGDDASTFRSRFAKGEIAMMFDNASVLFTILDGNKQLTSSDVGVAHLPFPTDNDSLVTNFIGINKNTKRPDEAMAFLKWLSSPDGQKVAAGGIFPTLNATATPPPADIVAKYPWIKVYAEAAKTAKGSPLIPGFELQTPQISTIIMKAIEKVLVSNADPTTSLQDAQKAAEAI